MIKERIIQVIEFKGIAKEKFYLKIGLTSANFRGLAKKTPINSNAIANILSEMPDLNLDWLFTGKGAMLKTENKSGTEREEDLLKSLSDKQAIIDLQKEKIERLEVEIKNLSKDKSPKTKV